MTHKKSWIGLDADTKKEVINSLSIVLHNGRMVDITFTRGRSMRGAMGDMFTDTFAAGCDPHGIYRYEDVIAISMSPGRIV